MRAPPVFSPNRTATRRTTRTNTGQDTVELYEVGGVHAYVALINDTELAHAQELLERGRATGRLRPPQSRGERAPHP
jgi:hypothetical protein